jgi:large subunit ribosomal protein L30
MARLRIRYKKSSIGYNQRETIRSLGLIKLNRVVEREDTPTVRGMLHAVRHLVEVVEVHDDTSSGGQS